MEVLLLNVILDMTQNAPEMISEYLKIQTFLGGGGGGGGVGGKGGIPPDTLVR